MTQHTILPTKDQALQLLATISSSPTFAKSGRLRDLLRYLVTEAIERPNQKVTAESIASSIFNRGAAFVSIEDPIVRTTVSRLRSALTARYEDKTCNDRIAIVISRGSYTPSFVARHGMSDENAFVSGNRAARSRGLGVALAAGALTALVAAFLALPNPDGPLLKTRVFVQPVHTLTDDTSLKEFGAEVNNLLLTDLSSAAGADVTDASRIARAAIQDLTTKTPAYLLQTTAWRNTQSTLISWRLLDAHTGTVVWAPSDPIVEAGQGRPDTVASAIAAKVGGAGGAISVLDMKLPATDPLSACMAQSRRFVFVANEDNHRDLARCLEGVVAKYPATADAWAMLAYSYGQIAQLAASHGDFVDPYRVKAKQAAQHAQNLVPDALLTQEVLAYVAFGLGDMETFQARATRLLARYPGDADLKIRLGVRLSTVDAGSDGRELILQGIRDGATTALPSAYQVLALASYMKGDYRLALEHLEKSSGATDYQYYMLRAAILGETGQLSGAQEAIGHLLLLRPQYQQAYTRDLAARNVSKRVQAKLAEGLGRAGLFVRR